jgi:hypothetical protein
MLAGQASSYDELPYADNCFHYTHPDHLAAIGTVFGMTVAPSDRCRLLELGCAQVSESPANTTFPVTPSACVRHSGPARRCAENSQNTAGKPHRLRRCLTMLLPEFKSRASVSPVSAPR